MKAEPGRMYSS